MTRLLVIGLLTLSGSNAWASRLIAESVPASNNSIFIDTGNARMGIGITNPSYFLDVSPSTVGTAGQFASSTTANGVLLRLRNTSSAGFSGIEIYDSANVDTAGFNYGNTGTTGGQASNVFLGSVANRNLTFLTNNVERARIDTSGNLGIGVTNAANPLDVFSNTAFQIAITTTANLTWGAGIGVERSAGSIINNSAEGDLAIFTRTRKINLSANGGSTVHVTLGTTGNVGIGTTNPATLLHCSTCTITIDGNAGRAIDATPLNAGGVVIKNRNLSSTGFSNEEFFDQNNTDIGGVGYGNGGAAAPLAGTMFLGSGTGGGGRSVAIVTNNVVVASFTVAGLVGIGTTNPLTTLDVAGGVGLQSRTISQLLLITPAKTGQEYYCSDCVPAKGVISTGTAVGNFADMAGGAFQ